MSFSCHKAPPPWLIFTYWKLSSVLCLNIYKGRIKYMYLLPLMFSTYSWTFELVSVSREIWLCLTFQSIFFIYTKCLRKNWIRIAKRIDFADVFDWKCLVIHEFWLGYIFSNSCVWDYWIWILIYASSNLWAWHLQKLTEFKTKILPKRIVRSSCLNQKELHKAHGIFSQNSQLARVRQLRFGDNTPPQLLHEE